MASFSNVSSHLVARELSIASSFVKQYYTLLNKAPHLIHNFYSHNSTFIHGSVEMANVQYTEPMVGREKIKKKMEDLKLNDCRAKIKQIDCLETLAGGLVIQVIGELSNNGKPMRRFLQTFVLAPRADESRQDQADQQQQQPTVRPNQPSSERQTRGVQFAASNPAPTTEGYAGSPACTQKFFVLNSIFRYQDDALESESEEELVGQAHATSHSENHKTTNKEISKSLNVNLEQQANNSNPTQHHNISHSNGTCLAETNIQPTRKRLTNEVPARKLANADRLTTEPEETVELKANTENEKTNGNECKKESMVSKVVSNEPGSIENKSESHEKSTENGKSSIDHAPASCPNASLSNSSSANQLTSSAPKPQPSNEPKTWANMVRNAHPSHPAPSTQPPPSATSASSGGSAVVATTAVSVTKPVTVEHQSHQNSNQSQSSQLQSQPHQQAHQQQQLKQTQQLQQQPQSPSQQSQSTHLQQPQQQNQGQQPPQQLSHMNNNLGRRRMQRKPPSKSSGRSMKSRSRAPGASSTPPTTTPSTTTPAYTVGKPVA